MSASHHGNESDNMQRFVDQINGTARREYPAGRMGAEDDGALVYAIAADVEKQRVVIRFGKRVEWIGLGVDELEALRDKLSEHLFLLRGITK